MNKQEFMQQYFGFLEKENLRCTDVIVGAGGSMLMRGLRETTHDIDAGLVTDDFNLFLDRGLQRKEISNDRFAIVYNEFIDLHDEGSMMVGEIIDGVFCEHLKDVLERKLRLNRPKDQEDIMKLQAYMEKKS